ncbi:MAG: DegT/DnrJ/EryC1/StrS family aminotransferase [Rhodospirillales bacterium]
MTSPESEQPSEQPSEKPPETRDIPFGRPYIDDRERLAVTDILRGHILTHGPKCAEFETAFRAMTGGGHAVTVSSCMAALHLAVKHFGFGPGDEVIVPAMSHVATVHAVELEGATPVFVDCETVTGNMDIDALAAAVTPKTKGIALVHFAGMPMAMPRVMDIAEKHGLAVIEDAATAVGARYNGTHVGLFGDAGCFSFYPVKHITTGEGGMLISKDEETAEAIASFRAFSVDRTHAERRVPGVYNVTGPGMNCRMSEMQAAMGCVQLTKIKEILEKRRNNFRALKPLIEQTGRARVLDVDGDDKAENSYYCAVVMLDDAAAAKRFELVHALNGQGVGTSVYYPCPIPRFDYYAGRYGYTPGQYPGAERIADGSIALPVGPHLDEDDMVAVAEVFSTGISAL